MVQILVTLSPRDTLAVAAETLLKEQISGAPVVNEKDQCVGVLSVSDLIRAEGKVLAEQQQIAESSFFNSGLVLPTSVYSEKLEQVRDKLAPVSEQPVERFMTRDLVSVGGDEPIATVVRDIVDAHVHRVLVLSQQHQLLGIISTIDLLAALQRKSIAQSQSFISLSPGTRVMANQTLFNSLLVPVDFSESSNEAFQRGIELAAGDEPSIIALHVIDEALIDLMTSHDFGDRDELIAKLREQAERRINEFTATEDSSVEVDRIVSVGIPFIEIIRKSDEFAVDAIVMGKIGDRKHFEKLLFGSTAERVIRSSARPVIVFPGSFELDSSAAG